jgi:PST family polysaccharide transporter
VLRELIGYGKFFTGAAFLGFFIANFDNVAIGRWAGATALGAYTLAYAVVNLVPTFLSVTVGKVFFPLYTSLRRDQATLRRAYRGALHFVMVIMLPVAVGFATVAPKVLVTIFGSEWEAITPVLRVLAIYALARSLGSAAVNFLAATGKPGYMLSTEVLNFVVTVVTLIAVVHHGVTAIAAAFAAGQVTAALYSTYGCRGFLDQHLLERLRAPIASTCVALVAASPVVIISSTSSAAWLGAGIYVVAYLVTLLLIDAWVRANCWPIIAAVGRVVSR